MQDEDGFGLLEALVAFFLVSSAFAGFVTLISTSSQLLQRAEANHLQHEKIMSMVTAQSGDESETGNTSPDANITALVNAEGLELIRVKTSARDGSKPLIYVRPIEGADH